MQQASALVVTHQNVIFVLHFNNAQAKMICSSESEHDSNIKSESESDSESEDESESNSESESNRRSRYYFLYESYISPTGERYLKNNATVPNELLVPYIKHMNYLKFEMTDCTIELFDKKKTAKIKKYFPHKNKTSTWKVPIDETLYKRIYSLIKRPEVRRVACFRPSYIYSSKFTVGSDCGYDSDALEDLKFSEAGCLKVTFYPGINAFRK